MNANRQTAAPGPDQYRSLQILDELSNNDSLTQRDLSSRLGIALGLVNSYIKNLVKKGFITVKAIPAKRYTYYLTPKGFNEKTRLAYDLLHDYTRIYREARTNLERVFHELEIAGIRNVVFAGADEVAEIAYITLQNSNLKLTAVVDDGEVGKKFFGKDIQPLQAVEKLQYDCIVITTYVRRKTLFRELLALGVKEKDIKAIFAA